MCRSVWGRPDRRYSPRSVVLGLYGAFALWVTWTSLRRPEIAAVLLMPSTLAIPAMIGEHGSIDQQSALMILSEVTLITAIAAAVVWLFPGWPQLLAGGGAFAIELVRLWVLGRGPWRHETSGAIVSVVYVTMLLAGGADDRAGAGSGGDPEYAGAGAASPLAAPAEVSYESALYRSRRCLRTGSSSSDFGSMTVIEATVSLAPLMRISVTPWVARPTPIDLRARESGSSDRPC